MNLRERMRALRETWSLTGYDLDAGVGIAEGDPTLGRVGFEARLAYRATGTVANIASRLCSQALGKQILLSPRAYANVRGVVDIEPIGPCSSRDPTTPCRRTT